MSVGEVDQWWERMEVSSCAHRKDRIIDGDPSTFWESSGRAGTHWVRIHMRKGLVIRSGGREGGREGGEGRYF